MNERTNKGTNEGTNEGTKERTNERTDGRTNKQVNYFNCTTTRVFDKLLACHQKMVAKTTSIIDGGHPYYTD